MKGTGLFLIGLLLLANGAVAQADCVLKFTYQGKIKGNVKIGQIYLPSAGYLSGRDNWEDQSGFYVLTVESEKFETECSSYMSSDFCMELPDIVERVFKKVTSYPVRIYEEKKDHTGIYKIYEFEIPTEKIKFTITDDKHLVVELPLIEI